MKTKKPKTNSKDKNKKTATTTIKNKQINKWTDKTPDRW